MEDSDPLNFNIDFSSSFSPTPKFTSSENLKINDIYSRIAKHKEFLISNVYLQWFERVSPSTTSLGTPNPSHEYSVFKIANGYVEYHQNKMGFVKEITDPDLPSVELAIDHLKTGYDDIIELWNTIKNDGNHIMHLGLDCLNDIEEAFNQKIIDISFSQLQNYSSNENISTNYFQLNEIVKLIYNEISKKQQNFINNTDFYLHDLEPKFDPTHNSFIIENGVKYIKSTNSNTINQFRNLLMELINDISFNYRIKEITKRINEVNNKINELEKGLKNIHLEHCHGLELAGYCNLCKRIKQINK